MYIPISKIKPNPWIRDVDKDTPFFEGLCKSIVEKGILVPLLVANWTIIDGNYRYEAARYVGQITLPCFDMGPITGQALDELLIVQSTHKKQVKPMELRNMFLRVLGSEPSLTMASAMKRFSVEPEWIEKILFLRFDEPIKTKVRNGNICLCNAHMLAKLPAQDQEYYMYQAMSMDANDFVPMIHSRLRDIKQSRRKRQELCRS